MHRKVIAFFTSQPPQVHSCAIRSSESYNSSKKYRILFKGEAHITQHIGRGSFSNVFSVQTNTGHRFALKLSHDNPEHKKQNTHEYKLLRELNHPNIIRTFGNMTWAQKGHIGTWLEHCENSTYGHFVKSPTTFITAEEFRQVALQSLSGLAYLAEQGVRHQDIKPDNLFLRETNPINLCIGDLNSASTGPLRYWYVQSRWYRAPEIIVKRIPITPKMDVWSLGATLVELVAKRPLFPGDNERAMLCEFVTVLGPPEELFSPFFSRANPASLMTKQQTTKAFLKFTERFTEETFKLITDTCLVYTPENRKSAQEALEIFKAYFATHLLENG